MFITKFMLIRGIKFTRVKLEQYANYKENIAKVCLFVFCMWIGKGL